MILGLYFNYLRSWGDSDDNIAKANSNNYTIGAYIQKIWDSFFIEGALSGTIEDIELDRYSNNSKINEASPDGYGIMLQTRGAKIFEYKNYNFLPNIGLRYFYNHIDSYLEKNEIINRLDVSNQKSNTLEVLLGTVFSYNYLVSYGAVIPQIEITYIADVLRDKTSFDSKFATSSVSQNIKIRPNPDHTIRLGAGIDFRFVNCSILNVNYVASFATHMRITNEVRLGYRIDF